MIWKVSLVILGLVFVAANGLYYFRCFYHKHLTFERAHFPAIDAVYKDGMGGGFDSDIEDVRAWAKENGIVCLSAFINFPSPAKDVAHMPSLRGCVVGGRVATQAPFHYVHFEERDYLIGTLLAKKPALLVRPFNEVKKYLKANRNAIIKTGGPIAIYDWQNPLLVQPVFKILTPVADVGKDSLIKEVTE